jgi:peptidoglycan-associated lipoprotein
MFERSTMDVNIVWVLARTPVLAAATLLSTVFRVFRHSLAFDDYLRPRPWVTASLFVVSGVLGTVLIRDREYQIADLIGIANVANNSADVRSLLEPEDIGGVTKALPFVLLIIALALGAGIHASWTAGRRLLGERLKSRIRRGMGADRRRINAVMDAFVYAVGSGLLVMALLDGIVAPTWRIVLAPFSVDLLISDLAVLLGFYALFVATVCPFFWVARVYGLRPSVVGFPAVLSLSAGLALAYGWTYVPPLPPPAPAPPALGATSIIGPLLWSQDVCDRVFFSLRSSNLTDQGKATLDQQLSWLTTFPTATLRIAGNTDETEGDDKSAMALGDKRANAVAAYFVTHGVAQDRISTASYGRSRPTAFNSDEKSWAQNRNAITLAATSPSAIDQEIEFSFPSPSPRCEAKPDLTRLQPTVKSHRTSLSTIINRHAKEPTDICHLSDFMALVVVKKILAEHFDIDPDKATPSATIKSLGLDKELDWLELQLALEVILHVDLVGSELRQATDVRGIVGYIGHLAASCPKQ